MRSGVHCIRVSGRSVTFGEAADSAGDCGGEEAEAGEDSVSVTAIRRTPKRLRAESGEADHVWLAGAPGESLLAGRGSRIYQDDDLRRGPAECTAWSLATKAVEVVDCDKELPILCHSTLGSEWTFFYMEFFQIFKCFCFLVDSPAPKRSDLAVRPGPDSIVVDWERKDPSRGDAAPGWRTTYTVTVLPVVAADAAAGGNSTSNGTAAEPRVHSVESGSPPVSVGGLLPETEYTVVVETRLGPAWTSTVQLDGVHTTANDSELPKEIIGVSGRTIRLR